MKLTIGSIKGKTDFTLKTQMVLQHWGKYNVSPKYSSDHQFQQLLPEEYPLF